MSCRSRNAPDPRLIVLLLAAVLVVSACSTGGSGSDADPSGVVSPPNADSSGGEPLAVGEPMDLSVLVYNIEYGGDESTDRVIRELDADIVGVLESYNRLPEIARKTGYPYYNVGLQILSKYPIHEPSGADGLYSLIEVQPGYVVAFFNTHLDYVDFGPKLLGEGVPVDEVIASENVVRTASMEILTPSMESLLAQGYPTFLTGDFNQPSSLDYGADTVGTRPGIDEPVPWPVSELLQGIGMEDVFRQVHPDPLANPGFTHDNPGFAKEGEPDRIDYMYAGGPLTIQRVWLVGEKGGPNVDKGFEPWTSDHRAVLGSFEVSPVALRTTVSLDRRLITEGEGLRAYTNAPDHEGGVTVAVIPEGEGLDARVLEVEAGNPGTVRLDTADLSPGGYEVVMLDDAGQEVARNAFWVRSVRDDIAITTDKSEYAVGEPIVVSWDDGPANRWDWIGVFRGGKSQPGVHDYLLWGYVGGHEAGALPPQVFGEMTLDENSQGKPWPLPPGKYRIHYLMADKYNSAGYTDIRVVEG